MTIKIFVSHKNEDAYLAKGVADTIKKMGVAVYIDEYDPDIVNALDLADYFKKTIRDCTHLLAVVSEQTRLSWWVPFEIGLASAAECPLATFLERDVRLPGYLRSWPCVRRLEDLRTYLEVGRLLEEKVLLNEDMRKASASEKTLYFRQFNKELKKRLAP